MFEWLGQTFSLSDIPRVAFLSFLELVLSADNAIVLAILTNALAEPLRKKALYIGVMSAFLFRAIGIVSIAFLLKFFWIQLIGALYLLFLSLAHFIRDKKNRSFTLKPFVGFWGTVLVIELFDLAFAIDSIVAGVAFVGTSPQSLILHEKLWIVYLGGMLGVIGIRHAAHFLSSLIDQFPYLERAAYAMIGIVGIQLALTALGLSFPYLDWIFLGVLFVLVAFCFFKRKKK